MSRPGAPIEGLLRGSPTSPSARPPFPRMGELVGVEAAQVPLDVGETARSSSVSVRGRPRRQVNGQPGGLARRRSAELIVVQELIEDTLAAGPLSGGELAELRVLGPERDDAHPDGDIADVLARATEGASR